MAQQLFFSRDSKIYMKFGNKVWDLPVLDGFSFSQATNSSEITLAEMEGSGGVSRRGRRQFNDSLAPAEWSFSTYVRPFKAATGAGTGTADNVALTHAVEEALWAMFLGGKTYSDTHQVFQDAVPVTVAATAIVKSDQYVITAAGTTDFTSFGAADSVVGTSFISTGSGAAGSGSGTVQQVLNVPTLTSATFNAALSNRATMGTADIFFVLGNANRKVYKLKDCVVNEAALDFDIDGIATINWSGMSSEIIDMTGSTHTGGTNPPAFNAVTADGTTILAGDVVLDTADAHRLTIITDPTSSGTADVTSGIYEGTLSTTNFIRNRLTQLTVIPTAGTSYIGSLESGGYNITLTGGNITMSNNVTFITPEELGVVNTAIGHVTGTRSVSGSMSCYLSKDTTTTTSSADLWEDLKSITNIVSNSFELNFKIGGATAGTSRLEVKMPTCHLEIPTHSIEDVISVETSFNALPSTIDGTNEATITYFSKQ